MSTRMSLYSRGPIHIYVELVTDWVRLGLGEWLDVGLYKRMRGWRGRLGTFACRMNHHAWFIDTHYWESETGKHRYRCTRPGCDASK